VIEPKQVYRSLVLGIGLPVTAVRDPSEPFFEDVLSTPHGELKVFRGDGGWYVRNGKRDARSRYLDEALEHVLGGPLDHASVRALVEMLDRELTAERSRTGKAGSRELSALN
jgi:hypothetical protein